MFGTTASSKEQKEFEKWLVESDESKEKEVALQELWASVDAAPDKAVYNSLRQVRGRITDSRRKKHIGSLPLQSIVRVAVVVLLFVSAAAGAYWLFDSPSLVLAKQTKIIVHKGERKQVFLPDGSVVWINADSELTYGSDFNTTTRTVYLCGEANFKVKKDPECPFIVETNSMRIEALGTEFNVMAYANDVKTTASLHSGKIQIDLKSVEASESYILTPNQQLEYDTEHKTVTQTSSENSSAEWVSGKLIFQGATLKEIIQALERHYNVSIMINQGESTDLYYIKFVQGESIQEAMRALEEMIDGLSYELGMVN